MFHYRKNNLKKINSMFAAAAVFAFLVTGCSNSAPEDTSSVTEEKITEMTSSLPDETFSEETASVQADANSIAEAVTTSPVSNLTVPENAPYSTDISTLFTDRDFRTEYEITSSINLDEVTDSVLTITQAGIYELTGTLKDGQIRINSEDKVQIVLHNANISCSSGSAIYIENAKKAFITLADGSVNTVSDGTGYSSDTVSGAAIYSSDDLTINGSGSLTVNGNEDEGITSKDELTVTGGNITVNAVGNGINGKDSIAVYDGTFAITSGGTGLKSSNATDEGKGFIYIHSGNFTVNAQGDGIQAETELIIENGTFDITSGGGTANAETKQNNDFGGGFGRGDWNNMQSSETTETDTVSVKGIKAGTILYISGGNISLNTADDALHSNGSLYLTGGEFHITAGDKGIHADTNLTIAEGIVNITQSYEGIEATDILVSGGTVILYSSDDGFNASDGSDEGARGNAVNCSLEISGGYVYVNANGDGLDSNGKLTVSGGTVLVDGPTNDGNGALDSNNGIIVTGGFLLAAGSSGMAEYPEDASQNTIVMTLDNYQEAETLVTLCDENGTEIISYAPSKKFNFVVVSSDALESGKTYTLYLGGTSSAASEDGLYTVGSYQNDGTESGSVTLEDSVSFIGTAKSMGMMGGGGFGGGHMGGGMNGGQPGNMELPTDENGNVTMPEDFDPSQMQGGGHMGGGQMPDGMELPTDENGEIDRSQMKGGRGMKSRPGSDFNPDAIPDGEIQNT